jgi:hypothetical protein
MDDEKRYTIQIKGTAYKFRPLPDEDLGRLQLIFNMNASVAKTLKAITAVLKESVGPEAWDELTDRLITKELTIHDIVGDPVKKLIERQLKDRKADD